VLLLVDVINDLEWDGGDLLQLHAEAIAPRLAALLERARAAGVAVVYVNDNYGRWRSDLQQLVAHCLEDGVRGERLAELLKPEPDDYFVLKPKHSGFYCSALDVLLADLGARTLIITGLAGNICVLYTAYDAHMRNFEIIIPSDCLASNTVEENDFALRQMSAVLGADTRSSEEISFERRSGDHLGLVTAEEAQSTARERT
jgi:nicotinamidase-related amidase